MDQSTTQSEQTNASQATVSESDQLTVDEVAVELGVARTTVLGWLERSRKGWAKSSRRKRPARGCPVLDNEVIIPDREERAGPGGRPVTIFRAIVERIKEKMKEAATGRWLDKQGGAWLDRHRALHELKKVRKSLVYQTLFGWTAEAEDNGDEENKKAKDGAAPASEEEGSGDDKRGKCPHLKDKRPIKTDMKRLHLVGRPQLWFWENDILLVKKSLEKVQQGYYPNPVNPDDPYLTPKAFERDFKSTRQTLRRWEAKGWITPYYEPRRRGGGPGGEDEPVYLLSQLQKADAKWKRVVGKDGKKKRKRAFNGIYNPQTPKERHNAKAAAKVLGVTTSTVYVLMNEGVLPFEMSTPPCGADERTILTGDLMEFKRKRFPTLSAKAPDGNWKSRAELGEIYGATEGSEWIALGKCLAYWRDNTMLTVMDGSWELPNGGTKPVWYYAPAEVHDLLNGRKPSEAWAEIQASIAAANGSPDISAQPEDSEQTQASVGAQHATQEPQPSTPAEQSELTAVERAIQIFMRDPNLSVRQIAKKAGCTHVCLINDDRFRRLREAYQGRVLKGAKSKDGHIEATESD